MLVCGGGGGLEGGRRKGGSGLELGGGGGGGGGGGYVLGYWVCVCVGGVGSAGRTTVEAVWKWDI
jgi:hypothetical protein